VLGIWEDRVGDGPDGFPRLENFRLQEMGKRAVRTVRVRNISDLATEREVREFFSFSGEIEHVDIRL
jgi:RNA recognition motif-containing protein